MHYAVGLSMFICLAATVFYIIGYGMESRERAMAKIWLNRFWIERRGNFSTIDLLIDRPA
jgi:hypothetical protein